MDALVNLPGIVQRMTQDFEHEIAETNARDNDRDIAMESLSSLSALRTKLERLERNAVVKLVSSGVLKAGEAAQALDVRERNIELTVNAHMNGTGVSDVNASNTPLVLAKTGVGSGRVLTPIESLNRVIEKHNLPFTLDDIVFAVRPDSGITVPDTQVPFFEIEEFSQDLSSETARKIISEHKIDERRREEQKRIILEFARLCRERGTDIQAMLSYPEKQKLDTETARKFVSLGGAYQASDLTEDEIKEALDNDSVVIALNEFSVNGKHLERQEGESESEFLLRVRDFAHKCSGESHKDGMFERFLDKTPSDYDYDRSFEKHEDTATRKKMEDHLESRFDSKSTNSDDGDLQNYEEDLAIVNGNVVMRASNESFKDFESRVARLVRESNNDRNTK